MAETQAFIAVGEEGNRGAKEVVTVGFIAVNSLEMPEADYMLKEPTEFRGEDTALGDITPAIRMGEKWEGLSLEMPAFTESGVVSGMIGTIFKHFFGKATSVQNAATGQYAHMIYAVNDPFNTANLGAKALTFSLNAMHETTLKNHPYIGGRVSKLSFKQELGEHLIITAEAMGQKLLDPETGLVSPSYPAENLRLDYNNMAIRTGGTVTRTGVAPDYTNITSTGDLIKADSIEIDVERGMEDKLVSDGTTSPNKTTVGKLKGTLSMTIDFRDPSSGFSSVDEFTVWLAGSGEIDILGTWNSGTQAGTGDNHALILDMPRCERLGGMPEISREEQSTITLKYKFLVSPTTLYAFGLLLKNTAAAV